MSDHPEKANAPVRRDDHREMGWRTLMKRLLLSCWLVTIATGAFAQTCVVSDPTGTPLNVRARPNGSILGALHNGAHVQVLQISYVGGRPWAYIAPLDAGRRGWVFAGFLNCGR